MDQNTLRKIKIYKKLLEKYTGRKITLIKENKQAQETIQKYSNAIQHAIKIDDIDKAERLRGRLKGALESLGYNWKVDPRAVDAIGDDFISESKKVNKVKKKLTEADDIPFHYVNQLEKILDSNNPSDYLKILLKNNSFKIKHPKAFEFVEKASHSLDNKKGWTRNIRSAIKSLKDRIKNESVKRNLKEVDESTINAAVNDLRFIKTSIDNSYDKTLELEDSPIYLDKDKKISIQDLQTKFESMSNTIDLLIQTITGDKGTDSLQEDVTMSADDIIKNPQTVKKLNDRKIDIKVKPTNSSTSSSSSSTSFISSSSSSY